MVVYSDVYERDEMEKATTGCVFIRKTLLHTSLKKLLHYKRL